MTAGERGRFDNKMPVGRSYYKNARFRRAGEIGRRVTER